jgi:hypothetical protein
VDLHETEYLIKLFAVYVRKIKHIEDTTECWILQSVPLIQITIVGKKNFSYGEHRAEFIP